MVYSRDALRERQIIETEPAAPVAADQCDVVAAVDGVAAMADGRLEYEFEVSVEGAVIFAHFVISDESRQGDFERDVDAARVALGAILGSP